MKQPDQALSPEKRYRANPDFLLRTIAGETILMPTGTQFSGMLLPVTETAAFILRQLEAPKTIGEVICAAQEEYTDEEGMLPTHIREFIEENTKSGLVLEEE